MQTMVVPNIEDPMLKFNTSVLTGDVQERVSTLIASGQLPLAYLSARAHNLHEQVEYIESKIMDSEEYDLSKVMEQTEKYLGRAKALLPVRPIQTSDGQSYFQQWPMTNLRAKEAEKAASVFERKRQMLDEGNDKFFDGNEFSSTTNKQVANILDS